jgi:hypothetical protein
VCRCVSFGPVWTSEQLIRRDRAIARGIFLVLEEKRPQDLKKTRSFFLSSEGELMD